MDANLRILSERLRRLLLADEEGGTLPHGAAKEHLQNLLAESELVSSLLMDYEYNVHHLQWRIVNNEIDSPELQAILKEINRFANESDKVVDSIIISNIMQQRQQDEKGETSRCCCSKEELCVSDDDALVQLQNKIITIKQRAKQLQPNKSIPTEVPNSVSSTSEFKKRDGIVVGLAMEDKMEELLDLLIEGQPPLSIVAIVGSIGFDKTAFAAEVYNSNYATNYFDCRAWVSFHYSIKNNKILENIMKYVMPPSEWNEIMGKDYQLKQEIFDQNGSRVLTTLTDTDILNLCRLENGEQIQLDLVPATIPLRATYEGWPFVVLYYGSKSLKENSNDVWHEAIESQFRSISWLPLYLKLCCLYLCTFYEVHEIYTRELYQLWIAEGFIPDDSEATADEYLEELIDRGFIQVKKRRCGGKIKVCTIPSITCGASWAMAEAMEFINCLPEEPEDESLKDVKRLSVFGNLTEFISLENSPDKYLHSLLHHTSNNHHLAPTDCENICKNFEHLRVLDLGSRVLNQHPIGIEYLVLLRYLKLNIPSLKSLPSSLCSLLNLLTLDMPSSHIDHTPDEIWKMNKLRHLNFGHVKLPTLPGKYCGFLENLNFISALHASSCSPEILGRLPNLQSLRIYGDLSYYQSVLSKSLCKLSCLQSLKLVNESKTTQLSKLFLSEFQFPQTLTHLSLSNTELKDDPMPTLEKLPQLEVLKLKQNSYLGRKLACGSNGFPCLKVLHLKSMLWLEEWVMGAGVMSKLERLSAALVLI